MYARKVKRFLVKAKPLKKKNKLVRVTKEKWEESSIEGSVSTENESASTPGPEYQYLDRMMHNLTQNVYEISRNIVTQKHSISVSSDIIPEFYPEKENHCIMRWINKIEELRQIYGWNDLTTTYYTTSRLRGLAKTWYESLPSVVFTWEELKTKMKDAFPSQLNYADQLNQMLRRYKKSNETMLEYFYSKVALLNQCKIYGREAVSCIISGIQDQHLQAVVRVADYQAPNEIIKFLKTLPDSRNMKVSSENFSSKMRYQNRALKENVSPITSNRRQCYGCGSKDHLLPACNQRQRKLCEKCGVRHFGECQRKDSNKKIFTITSTDLTTGKKYFMDAIINNKIVKVFVDLGASCSTIKESTRIELGLEKINRNILITAYGGSSIISKGKTNIVKVKLDQAEAEIDFIIVEDNNQDIPVLIGQNYTEQPHIKLIKDSSSLQILENNFNMLPFVVDTTPVKIPIWAKDSYIIPPKHVMNVICKLNYEGDMGIEESIRTEENNEYFIPGCVVRVINNETIIPVINPTDREIQINKRKIFARGQPFADEENCISSTLDKNENFIENEWQIGSELSSQERNQLKMLIQKYKSCFTSSLRDIGCCKSSEMKIELKDDRPVNYKPYRMTTREKEKVNEMVNELLESNIIRESNSPFSSPVILVKKKDGEHRLCIDYRRLNSKIKLDRFPLPRIDDQIDKLQGYKYFTSLDMTSGYYQIPIEENSKHITSFVTCDGQYEFNRMPFGLSIAPSVFQRMVNKVLGPARGTIAMAYLDDVIIPSTTFEQGLIRLESILKIFSSNNITLNPKKCSFFKTSIWYLGFEISEEGMRPGEEKTKSIRNFPEPQSVHNVRQFLGLTGFFRQFIKDYAIKARPLTQLTRKNEEWKWNTEQKDAFIHLRNELTKRPILAVYNPTAETEVHTDASQRGIAGILLQRNKESKLRVVSYFSRQTSETEGKYHSYELETLAIVETLKKFRVYLLDIQFKVVTDCNSIKTAATKKHLIPRIARWWLLLQEYTFTIEYRPGSQMNHVDALSRNPPDEQNSIQIMRIEVADWVLASQLNDDKVKNIHEVLKRKAETAYDKRIHNDYLLQDERIYRQTTNGPKWVAPKGMRREIVKNSHDEFGHFGLEKTLNKICESYWFPNMRSYVEKYIKSCIPCIYHKTPRGKQEGFLHSIEKVNTPFHTVHMDHLGPFPKSSSGKKFIIVAIEAFTKFVFLCATKDTKTQPVLKFLKSIINQFGAPQRLVTDKGTCYTSKNFATFCKSNGIYHIQTAVATPRANGQVERLNATVLSAIATTTESDVHWDRTLDKVQFAINNSVHSITKKTPSELMFGYRPRAPADARLTSEIQLNEEKTRDIQSMRKEVSERLKENQKRTSIRYNQKRKTPKKYKEGDLVVVRKQAFGDGQSKKLLPKYKGPFQIKKVLRNDRYIVCELSGATRSKRAKYENVEAVDKIKPWIPIGGQSEEESDAEQSDEQQNEDV